MQILTTDPLYFLHFCILVILHIPTVLAAHVNLNYVLNEDEIVTNKQERFIHNLAPSVRASSSATLAAFLSTVSARLFACTNTKFYLLWQNIY